MRYLMTFIALFTLMFGMNAQTFPDNNKVYTVKSERGHLLYAPDITTEYVVCSGRYQLTVDENSPNYHWAFVTNEEGEIFMYNIGAKKFVNYDGESNAKFGNTPLSRNFTFLESTGTTKEQYPYVIAIDGEHQINCSYNQAHGVLYWNYTADVGNMLAITEVDELSEATFNDIIEQIDNTDSSINSDGAITISNEAGLYQSIEPNNEGTEQHYYVSPLIISSDFVSEITFTFKSTAGRKATDSSGYPCVEFAEFYLYDDLGNRIPLNSEHFTTNAQEKTEGDISFICDDDLTTFFHSTWSGGVGEYHYIKVTVPEDKVLKDFRFGYRTRSVGGDVPSEIEIACNTNLVNGNHTGYCGHPEDNGGKNVAWSYNTDKKELTISGIGRMCTYFDCVTPWNHFMTELKSVVINDGVTNVGRGAFQGCSEIIEVDIPESVTAIEPFAFDGCGKITHFDLPDSISSFGVRTFGGCVSLKEIRIPLNTTIISAELFLGCSSLQKVEIHNSVTEIGGEAFKNCISLEVVSRLPEGLKELSGGMFSGCFSLKDIEIPQSVTRIGHSTFYQNGSLTTITIPENVVEFDDCTFEGCGNLKYITCLAQIPPKIQGATFDPLNPEKERILYVSDIAAYEASDWAPFFSKILSLDAKDDTIHNDSNDVFLDQLSNDKVYTLTSERAFLVYSDNLPNQICANTGTNVGTISPDESDVNQQFKIIKSEGNYYLFSVGANKYVSETGEYEDYANSILGIEKVDNANYPWKLSIGANYLNSQVTEQTPSGIKVDSWSTTDPGNCYKIQEVDPENLVENFISHADGTFTLRNTTGLFTTTSTNSDGVEQHYYTSPLISPSGRISEITFTFKSTVGRGLTDNSGYPFVSFAEFYVYDASGNRIALNSDNFTTNAQERNEGDISFICDDDLTTFFHSTWSDGVGEYHNIKVIIPDNIYLKDFKFGYVTREVQLEVPSEINISINSNFITGYCGHPDENEGKNVTWSYNLNTDELFISGNGRMKSFEETMQTPWEDYSVKNVRIQHGVSNIGSYAFQGCYELKNISLPESLTTIEAGAFLDCMSLKFVDIPKSVNEIGEEAFYKCTSLSAVNILSNGLKKLSNRLFDGCISLEEVIIPESVTHIGDYVFNNNSTLRGITIPKNVVKIGEGAFAQCENLKYVTCLAPNPPTLLYGSFDYLEQAVNERVLFVADVAAYQASDWVDYFNNFISISTSEKNVITSLRQLDNDKVYSITSARAFLLYSDQMPNNLCSSTGKDIDLVVADESDTNQHFKIIKNDDNYYLFSVGANKYVSQTGAFEDNPNTILKIEKVDNAQYPWKLSLGENFINSQTPDQWSSGILFDLWDKTDPGNCYCIAEVSSILPNDEVLGMQVELDENQDGYSIVGYNDSLKNHIVIPNEVNTVPITTIADSAFANAPWLKSIVVPSTITKIGETPFVNCDNLLAIEWNTSLPLKDSYFGENFEHGNRIAFVSDTTDIHEWSGNVVINGVANRIALIDGLPFYNPRAFTANEISFTREFTRKNKPSMAGGWESLVLPFDVQSITCEKGSVVPFENANYIDTYPCWIATLNDNFKFELVNNIKANTPCIIALPNSDDYDSQYNVSGEVTFMSYNVEVAPTDAVATVENNELTWGASYNYITSGVNNFAINNETYWLFNEEILPGGIFVSNLRSIKPFEAYFHTAASKPTTTFVRIMQEPITSIRPCINTGEDINNAWYTLQGVRLNAQPVQSGMYIHNGKVVIIK